MCTKLYRICLSINHECMRFHRSSGIIQRVRVLRRLSLQLALVTQSASTAVTKESSREKAQIKIKFHESCHLPIVTNKLDIVSRVARLDTIYADSVSVRRVASATSRQSEEFKG